MDSTAFIAPSVARVPLHTATESNRRIRDETLQRVDYYESRPGQRSRVRDRRAARGAEKAQ